MAPLPIITNICRVAVLGTTPSGTPWAHVFHFKNDTGGSMDSAIIAARTSIEQWYDKGVMTAGGHGWMNLVDSDCKTEHYRYTPLDGTTASTVVDRTTTGATSDQALAPDLAAIVSWHTAIRGPRGRGRQYLPGFGEGSNDTNGRFDSTNAATLATDANHFKDSMSLSSTPLVVASYLHNDYHQVLSASVPRVWAGQRRRR